MALEVTKTAVHRSVERMAFGWHWIRRKGHAEAARLDWLEVEERSAFAVEALAYAKACTDRWVSCVEVPQVQVHSTAT